MNKIIEKLKNKEGYEVFSMWTRIYRHILRGGTKRRGMGELLLLMYFAANEPVAISMGRLAVMMESSVGNVERAIKKLHGLDLIKIKPGLPNTYEINWDTVYQVIASMGIELDSEVEP